VLPTTEGGRKLLEATVEVWEDASLQEGGD
jgi:hypothetical protein